MKNTKEVAIPDIDNTSHIGTIYGTNADATCTLAGANVLGTVVAGVLGMIFAPSGDLESVLSIFGATFAVTSPLGYFVGKRASLKKNVNRIIGDGGNYKVLQKEARQMRIYFSSTPVKVIPLETEGRTGKFHLVVEGKEVTVRERLRDGDLWDRAMAAVEGQYVLSGDMLEASDMPALTSPDDQYHDAVKSITKNDDIINAQASQIMMLEAELMESKMKMKMYQMESLEYANKALNSQNV